MRIPTTKPEDIRSSILDIINFLAKLIGFQIKMINWDAVASANIEIILRTDTLSTLKGAVQICGTALEQPSVQYDNTASVKVTYSCGASTSGKQTSTFLLVGR